MDSKLQSGFFDHCAVTFLKARHGIRSRKITKLISSLTIKNSARTAENAQKFVEEVRRLDFFPSTIFNADQTGLQFELHGGRTLAFIGQKSIECMSKGVSYATHSATLMFAVNQEGKLAPKVFVQLGVRNK